MKIVKSISCAGTNLDIYDEPVGIMVSGGVDSAILLYYLMKHAHQTIHIYSLGSNLKHRRNAIVSPRVVEKCIELTGNINVVHHIEYNARSTYEHIASVMPEAALKDGKIQIIYNGVTRNPPDDIANSFAPELAIGLDRSDDNNNILHRNNTLCTPWANTDKQGIAEMYKEEDLMNSLFPVTRSCEYDPTCDYFDDTPDPQLGHCGECWWCKEREWGFGTN